MATVTARKPRRRIASEPPPAPPVDRALVDAEEYWAETRRPFACLLFLAPLLIAYEAGVLWLGDGREELLRNGADVWMRSWLYALGVHHSFVLPLVVLALLLVWNFYGYFQWRVRTETLGGMLAESLIYAFALVVAGQASDLICRHAGVPTAAIEAARSASVVPLSLGRGARNTLAPLSLVRGAGGEGRTHAPVASEGPLAPTWGRGNASESVVLSATPRDDVPTEDRGDERMSDAGEPSPLTPDPSYQREGSESASSSTPPSGARLTVARAVTFVGAGIYEEVLFRLLLLPACYAWFRLFRAGPRASASLAVLATSLMFALAHYVGPAGDALVPYTFCFRAAAGAYFAVLFVTRGFGVTVGAHACYDLIVGVLWAT